MKVFSTGRSLTLGICAVALLALGACSRAGEGSKDVAQPSSSAAAPAPSLAQFDSSAVMAGPLMTTSPGPLPEPGGARVNAAIPSHPEGIRTRAELLACGPQEDSLVVSVEALAKLLGQSQCVSQLLSALEPDWRVGYVLQAKIFLTSVGMVRALERKPVDSPTEALEAQRQLVERETLAKLKLQTYSQALGAVDNVTESIASGVVKALLDKGVELVSPQPEIDARNQARRNAGLDRLLVDYGQFGDLLVLLPEEKDHAFLFSVAGLGPVFIRGAFEPRETATLFGENCQVTLSMADVVQKYGCRDYISGLIGDSATASLVRAVETELLKKAGRK